MYGPMPEGPVRSPASIRPVRVATPEAVEAPLRAALAGLGAGVRTASWQADPRDGDILVVAPHEYPPERLAAILGAVDWSWVHLTSAGVDFVDLASWPPDRLLTRSWQCYAAPLAEYALGAIMTHEWRHGTPWTGPPAPDGAGLWESRIGVAGWGAVGRRVATVARTLGASVTVLSRTPRASRRCLQHTTRLDDILDVDHLVIGLPFDATTRGLFGRDVLARMRTGLHLVNVSRAGILDQAALAEFCAEGRLAATLDVTDPEPLPAGHFMRTIPALRISPHIAWRSRRSDAAFVIDLTAIWTALAGGSEFIPGSVGGYSARRARAAVLAAGSHAPGASIYGSR